MLYQLHEMQRAFLQPFVAFSGASAQMLTHPDNPFSSTPMARHLSAGYELLHRLGKAYEKPDWHLPTTEVDGKTVAVTPTVVTEHAFCRLLHFARDIPARRAAKDPRVLVVAPLSGHHATLLRDTVRALLPEHEVYVTDWTDARMVPLSKGAFHLDDYVRTVQSFLRQLGPDLHVIAVCQPTVPVLAAIALMASQNDPKQPRSMIMMGGPIDPREAPTQVNELATQHSHSWFESKVIHTVPVGYPGAGRLVYPGFLQHAGFVAMNPSRHLKSHYDFYLDLLRGDDDDAEAHRRFYDEYNAVLDMPAEYYLDTIQVVFQEFRLPQGTWVIDGQRVAPEDIKKVALLTVEGELDDISGLGQTRAAQKLCRGIPAEMKQHYMAPRCGHYGIFSGRRWRETICPKIAAFVRQHA